MFGTLISGVGCAAGIFLFFILVALFIVEPLIMLVFLIGGIVVYTWLARRDRMPSSYDESLDS